MTRFGEPIQSLRISGGVDPQIKYSLGFAEWESASAAGLNLYEWETGKYPMWFKAKVVAWYNLHKMVEMHTQEALAKDVERKSRQKKGQ